MSKIILHVDFNSFFASVEQQANPFLRGKAIAVAGKSKRTINVHSETNRNHRSKINQLDYQRSVITTSSKEAKAQGVKTAMSTNEAKKLCPELIIIPGDPQKYSKITKTFLSILKEHSDSVEQFSTDEAFADITFTAKDYFGAIMIAQIIRNEIKEKCGEYCTASIGIAPNKLVAKLACESVKPNGLTVIKPKDVQNFILSKQLNDICGIGHQVEKSLNSSGITTMQSLLDEPLEKLIQKFKPSYGSFLYNSARGIGSDKVLNTEESPKSIGNSYTFPHDLDNEAEIKTNLLALCDKVASRMRKNHFVATNISVYVRYSGFLGTGKTKTSKTPIQDGLDIYKNAWSVLKKTLDPNIPVRLIGISVSGLIRSDMPNPLFKKQKQTEQALKALDKLEYKFGSGIWQRASTMNTIFKERVSGWHYDHET